MRVSLYLHLRSRVPVATSVVSLYYSSCLPETTWDWRHRPPVVGMTSNAVFPWAQSHMCRQECFWTCATACFTWASHDDHTKCRWQHGSMTARPSVHVIRPEVLVDRAAGDTVSLDGCLPCSIVHSLSVALHIQTRNLPKIPSLPVDLSVPDGPIAM